MPVYKVTTGVTAYETYTVAAEDEADARAQVLDERTRVALAMTAVEAGFGDDFAIIDVSEGEQSGAPGTCGAPSPSGERCVWPADHERAYVSQADVSLPTAVAMQREGRFAVELAHSWSRPTGEARG